MAESQEPWVEKYRPRVMEDIVLPKRIKEKFIPHKFGIYNNLMLVGSSGIGKTTLAKILAGQRSCKMINGSLDSGIDTVRNTIINYCSSASLKADGKKVIIVDECDALSTRSQEALRGTIEMFVNAAYFIFTCNYPEKLLAPIRSRFEVMDMNFTQNEDEEQLRGYWIRLLAICKAEGLTITKDALVQIVKTSYPDFRTIIQNLQGIAQTTKTIALADVQNSTSVKQDTDLYTLLLNEFQPPAIYAFIKSRYMNKENEAYASLGEPFMNWLIANGKVDKVPFVYRTVHKYEYESNFTIDKLVSLTACAFELSQLFK